MRPEVDEKPRAWRPSITMVPWALLFAGLVLDYWPTLGQLAARWSNDPRYSHGFLVPIFALFLLWSRRGQLTPAPDGPYWWGLGLLALGVAARLIGGYSAIEWIDSASLLVMLAGVAALYGGRRALRWAGPSIGFLFFMMPLPYRLEVAVGQPLQRIATLASTYCLQMMGLPAVAEGNIILIDESRIGVVEACNGLGMLMMFFAFATAAILVIRRPWVDKVFVALSAVPIAMLANVIRITITGALHEWVGGRVADVVYHDLAGLLMMPMALAILWLELRLLSALLIEPSRASFTSPRIGPGMVAGPRPPAGFNAASGG